MASRYYIGQYSSRPFFTHSEGSYLFLRLYITTGSFPTGHLKSSLDYPRAPVKSLASANDYVIFHIYSFLPLAFPILVYSRLIC